MNRNGALHDSVMYQRKSVNEGYLSLTISPANPKVYSNFTISITDPLYHKCHHNLVLLKSLIQQLSYNFSDHIILRLPFKPEHSSHLFQPFIVQLGLKLTCGEWTFPSLSFG